MSREVRMTIATVVERFNARFFKKNCNLIFKNVQINRFESVYLDIFVLLRLFVTRNRSNRAASS
jgi:catabolite regulation protein CreA